MKDKNRAGTPLKWTYKAIRKQLPIVVLLVVLNSVLACAGTVIALVSKVILDSAQNKVMNQFVTYALVLIGVYALMLVLGSLTNYLTERCRASIELSMKSRFFQKITTKQFEDISSYHSGTLLNRLTSDVSVISSCVTNVLPQFVSVIVKLIFAFAVILAFEPWFAAIFGVGGIIVFFATRLMRKTLKKLHKKVQEEDDKVRSFWQECLSNLLAVKVFSNESNMANKSDELQKNCFKAKMKRAMFTVVTGACYSGVMYVGYLFSFLMESFEVQKFLIFMKLYLFFHVFGVISKDSLPNPRP